MLFRSKLPKSEYTLEEWVEFCEKNPQYLTVNTPSANSLTVNSLETALQKSMTNLLDLINPVEILKQRLTRENIIQRQIEELTEIFTLCQKNDNFTHQDEKHTYNIDIGLLFADSKIYIPPSLEGVLLAYQHLLGHWSVEKTMANLQMFYFPEMYSKTKRFIGSCYPCLLQNSSSRKQLIKSYPIPEHPFEEISMDLCENLNAVKGYQHLLIVQDVLSDYIIILPLKTKKSSEMSRIFMYAVLQHFNVKRIHSDNGPVFRNANWLSLMAALKITIINSSALNPAARGKAERAVALVKNMIKKMLSTASHSTLNWENLPYIVARLMNSTIVPKYGYSPLQMIFGDTELAETQFKLDNYCKPHNSIINSMDKVDKITTDIMTAVLKAQGDLQETKDNYENTINKNKHVLQGF